MTLALFSRSAFGADLALLINGFSIRHEHRLVMGETTRLYLSADDSSFTDVPTAEIASYEKDLALPAPADAYASTHVPIMVSSPLRVNKTLFPGTTPFPPMIPPEIHFSP